MENLILIIMLVLAVIIGWCGNSLYQVYHFPSIKKIPESKKDIIEDCKGLSVSETSNCLRDNIETFFKYRENNDSNQLTFNEIKIKGGDCKDWSELYANIGEDLGFYTKYVDFYMKPNSRHAITIISNTSDYCILDQIGVVGCGGLKDE